MCTHTNENLICVWGSEWGLKSPGLDIILLILWCLGTYIPVRVYIVLHACIIAHHLPSEFQSPLHPLLVQMAHKIETSYLFSCMCIYVCFTLQVLVSHRIAWQEGRAFFDASTCTPSVEGVTGRTEYTCRAGCSGSPGSVQFQYTAFSVGNGWSIGQGTKEIHLSGVTKFEAS